MFFREAISIIREIVTIVLYPTLFVLAVPLGITLYIAILIASLALLMADFLPGTNFGNESEFWAKLGPQKHSQQAH